MKIKIHSRLRRRATCGRDISSRAVRRWASWWLVRRQTRRIHRAGGGLRHASRDEETSNGRYTNKQRHTVLGLLATPNPDRSGSAPAGLFTAVRPAEGTEEPRYEDAEGEGNVELLRPPSVEVPADDVEEGDGVK